ncbi:hypothetical protein OKW96_16315 [Sphingobacterium sp. KU25419]|nr:hypothetical protein OKW96_16315 [Sphingobacterium sp. KU25419]
MEGYPKFLYCQNELWGDDVFVIHTSVPRFIAKRMYANDLSMFEIEWVDNPGKNDNYIDSLIVELQNWYLTYTNYLCSFKLG